MSDDCRNNHKNKIEPKETKVWETKGDPDAYDIAKVLKELGEVSLLKDLDIYLDADFK